MLQVPLNFHVKEGELKPVVLPLFLVAHENLAFLIALIICLQVQFMLRKILEAFHHVLVLPRNLPHARHQILYILLLVTPAHLDLPMQEIALGLQFESILIR
jgi:hypothetical protein